MVVEVVKEVRVPGETVIKEVVKEIEVIQIKEVIKQVQVPGKAYVTDPTTGKVIPAPEYGGTIVRLGQHEPPHTDNYFTRTPRQRRMELPNRSHMRTGASTGVCSTT